MSWQQELCRPMRTSGMQYSELKIYIITIFLFFFFFFIEIISGASGRSNLRRLCVSLFRQVKVSGKVNSTLVLNSVFE